VRDGSAESAAAEQRALTSTIQSHRHSLDDHRKDAANEGEPQRPAGVAPRRERAVERWVGQAGSYVTAGLIQHRAPNARARSPESHLCPSVSSEQRSAPGAGDGAQASDDFVRGVEPLP